MITATQYASVLRFRYSLDHFECGVRDDCTHVYSTMNEQLPSVNDVIAHLKTEHNLVNG